jgi:hypothetical protein
MSRKTQAPYLKPDFFYDGGRTRPWKMLLFVQTRNNYCQDDFFMLFHVSIKRLPPSQ